MSTEVKIVDLPSGAKLKIAPAPFAAAKALYDAVLRELKGVSIDSAPGMPDLYKNLFCAVASSPAIEACLWECFKRCLYIEGGDTTGMKVDADTFEPVARRADYTKACVEVTKENIAPFVKSLYADFKDISEVIAGSIPKPS